MKRLLPFLFLFLIGCVSPREAIHEDEMYITRKYIGEFLEMRVDKKSTCIMTTNALFHVPGKPQLDIPEGARCYVKYIPESRAGMIQKYWILYFTWDGTEDMFMIRQNWITGEI